MNIVVDDIGTVVTSMRGDSRIEDIFDALPEGSDPQLIPHYRYGHRLELARMLLSKSEGSVFTYDQYPLIALRMDIPEVKSNGIVNYNLNIGILAFTDKNYSTEERYANVIKPILYPLYDLFFIKLRDSGLFFWEPGRSKKLPDHTKIDRPFWGISSEEGNTQNIFNDPIDAIEIVDLKISSYIKC